MTVTPSGLHLMSSKSYLGASSDNLVLCSNIDTLCRGCVEGVHIVLRMCND